MIKTGGTYIGALFSFVFMMAVALPAYADINAVTPSTNDINRTNGWAHVDLDSATTNSVTLDFINTRAFYSCFEYRSDGDTSQVLSDNGGVNYNSGVSDGLYPYFCQNNNTSTHTIPATSYIEVRMVFGAESDERFDWTRFDVLPPPPVTVTIEKYIDGVHATALNANGFAFPMLATWNAVNIGSGSGSYDLDADGFNGIPTPYQAITSSMTAGADYSTSEVTGGSNVGEECFTGQPYELVGYSWGDSLSAAEEMALSQTAPNFTSLTINKVVIVWNAKCRPSTPTITSPAANMCYTTAQLQKIDWTDSTGAGPITYKYEAYNDASYTSLIYASGWLADSEIPTPGTPAGNYYVRIQAKDANGNLSDWSNGASNPYKITVSNTFTMSGLLSPLSISGKTFKQGSTIPVKIQITDACGKGVNIGTPTLTITNSLDGLVFVDPFRFDSASGQFISNWSTKVPTLLLNGLYTITATLSGVTSSPAVAQVSLVK